MSKNHGNVLKTRGNDQLKVKWVKTKYFIRLLMFFEMENIEWQLLVIQCCPNLRTWMSFRVEILPLDGIMELRNLS